MSAPRESGGASQSPKLRVCQRNCNRKGKPLDYKTFTIDPSGAYAKTCKACAAKRRKKKTGDAKGDDPDDDSEVPLSILPLDELSRLLGQIDVKEELEALVDIDEVVKSHTPSFDLKKQDFDFAKHKDVWQGEFRKQADVVAQLVWDATGYRYTLRSGNISQRRMNRLDDAYRSGRSKTLSWAQSSLKKSWRQLQTAPVSDKVYSVDVKKWTCTCGQQKYEAHHLCKHLVQAVNPPPGLEFFHEVYRRRTAPLYKHPLLDPDLDVDSYDEGSVTDGDDRKIYGNRQKALTAGRWREFAASNSSSKRVAVANPNEAGSSKRRRTASSTAAADDTPAAAPVPHELEQVDLIDLSMSSPIVSSEGGEVDAGSQHEQTTSEFEARSEGYSRSSSAYSPSDDEEETEEEKAALQKHLKTVVTSLRKAADIVEGQLELPGGPNVLWMRSLKSRRFGNDAQKLVEDIRKHTSTGRKRLTTMGKSSEKGSSRRAGNTIGYRNPLGEKVGDDEDEDEDEDEGDDEGEE
ncbi:hypothetical protein NMY22_g5568 [Coprinellus aureogranulatus]|nr:hypothetical protein NMY22_g5568 [Coprinellus aureogranulatus]